MYNNEGHFGHLAISIGLDFFFSSFLQILKLLEFGLNFHFMFFHYANDPYFNLNFKTMCIYLYFKF